MILARAPYRVSFVGGGSDLPAYCHRDPGMVVSTTIDRHIYVQISRRWSSGWVIRYGKDEHVETIADIEHPIIRECLNLHAVKEPLEIVVTGDLPGGLGLGSSSTLTVCLLAALDALRGRFVNAKALAQQACSIEMGRLNKPIGYQDAYAAAYGGLNEIRFKGKGNVWVEPLSDINPATIRALEANSLMVRVGAPRSADLVLEKQSQEVRDIPARRLVTKAIADVAGQFAAILRSGDLVEAANALAWAWTQKRALSEGISSKPIDEAYAAAIEAGAWGGKLLGAGGGGFLYLLAPPERHSTIRAALRFPQSLPFRAFPRGVEILFNNEVWS